MNYQEWMTTVPDEITQDPLWGLEVYRLALGVFALHRKGPRPLLRILTS